MKTILTFLITFVLIINTNVIYSQYSEQEKADLLFTLQEEKVAYDFYTEMYNKYNQKVFGNIMEAEKTHQQHVLSILNSLNIDAGEVGSTPGEFSNPEIADQYKMLSEIGSYSFTDALRAAAKYEEQDINDLKTFQSRAENEQIITLYECLQKATGNHLRAFVKNLKKEGINYKPNVLSEADYNAIITSDNVQGDCFQLK